MPNEKRSYAHIRQPTGSYSPAIRNGNFLFIAGMTAAARLDGPGDTGDLGEQARSIFETIGGILAAESGSYADLVTMNIFLTEGGADAYATVNRIRAEVFGDARPASTMVVIRELARPSAKIEVNAIALLNQ